MTDSRLDDRQLAVAAVYSLAMLDLAEKKGETASLLEEVQDLVSFLDQNLDFDAFLSSPLVETEAREKVIERILRGRASDLLVDSVQVINRKGRLDHLRSIAETYRLADQERRGFIDVDLATAVPLTEGLRARLKETVKRYSGKEAQLNERVDGSLLGGLILKIGDQKIDTSLASKLKRFETKLLDRASLEIQTRRQEYFSE